MYKITRFQYTSILLISFQFYLVDYNVPFNRNLLKLNHSQNGFPIVELDDVGSSMSYVSMNNLLFLISL